MVTESNGGESHTSPNPPAEALRGVRILFSGKAVVAAVIAMLVLAAGVALTVNLRDAVHYKCVGERSDSSPASVAKG